MTHTHLTQCDQGLLLRVYWREQGSNALNFQQTGSERAAQEDGQAARDEVQVAVAQATEIVLSGNAG